MDSSLSERARYGDVGDEVEEGDQGQQHHIPAAGSGLPGWVQHPRAEPPVWWLCVRALRGSTVALALVRSSGGCSLRRSWRSDAAAVSVPRGVAAHVTSMWRVHLSSPYEGTVGREHGRKGQQRKKQPSGGAVHSGTGGCSARNAAISLSWSCGSSKKESETSVCPTSPCFSYNVMSSISSAAHVRLGLSGWLSGWLSTRRGRTDRGRNTWRWRCRRGSSCPWW